MPNVKVINGKAQMNGGIDNGVQLSNIHQKVIHDNNAVANENDEK